ncbi:MAG: hypothetical protein KDA65_18170, partial [Planctomycetaceae bacterium]|nr:hypothetical protein [Planctomycetaceae bacterium]
ASDTAEPLNGYLVRAPQTGFPYVDDFASNSFGSFIPVTSDWTVTNGELVVDSELSWYKTGISLIDSAPYVPNEFLISTNFKITPQSGQASNSFIIFDYESPTKFKFAGTWAGQNRLVIGQYENNQFNVYSEKTETIKKNTEYQFELAVVGSQVTLSLDGLTKMTYEFGEDITDNPLGLGAYNSTVHFNDFALTELSGGTLKTPFPFSMSQGHDLEGTMYDINGNWTAQDDFVIGNSIGLSNPRGLTLFNPATTFPTQFDITTRMSSTFQGPGTANNAYIIFDYESPTQFKFAGMAVGQNRWVIGEFNNGWSYLSTFNEPLNTNQFYDVHFEVDGATVTLSRDGSQVVQHTFGSPVNDGLAGFMVINGESRFENIELGHAALPAPLFSAAAQRSYTIDSTDSNDLETTSVNQAPGTSSYSYAANLLSFFETGNDQNGFLVFNQLAANTFSLAGVQLADKKWVLAQYVNGVYQEVASLTDLSINPDAEYKLEIKVIGSTVTLLANDEEKLSFTYSQDQSGGTLGLAAQDAHSQFSNLSLTELSASDSVFADSLDELLS